MKKYLIIVSFLAITTPQLLKASAISNCTTNMGFGFYKIHNNTPQTIFYSASVCCNPLACCTTPNYKRLGQGEKAILARLVTSQIRFHTALSSVNVLALDASATKAEDEELYYTPQKTGAYNLHVTLNGNKLQVRETGTEWKPCGKEEVELP